MTKIVVFDLLRLPNLISSKIWVSQSENLTIFHTFKCGIFSLNQNSGTPCKRTKIAMSYMYLPNCQIWFYICKIWLSQSENCTLACPGLYVALINEENLVFDRVLTSICWLQFRKPSKLCQLFYKIVSRGSNLD